VNMLWEALVAVAPYVGSALGLFLLGRLRKPRDFERAALLVTIANAVAASVVIRFPGERWTTLLKLIIAEVERIIGPGFNPGAISREATRALSALGKSPE